MPVAAIYGTKHYAIQSDHLNTPRRLIQSDGQVAWQWAYSAFGEEKPTTAKTRFANTELNQSFGTTTVPAVTFNLRYPGQYFDQESSLHYNGHRSYCTNCGRYTQADPIDLQGGWNRFNYVGQNPLSFTDPSGLQAITIPAPILAPIAGSLARPSAGTLIDPIVIPGMPDPNDPNNSQKCKNLKKRINNLNDEIYNKRYPDLKANPGNLPQRIGPGEALRDTIRGHETLLNRQLRRVKELEEQYDKECVC
jgi:RHS repeat-associated protein